MRVVGDLVAGKYRVEELLAEGGMGVLFGARHETLDERVVVKFVRAADLDEQALARFEREARIAVKLRTEHVARVLDAGRDDAGDPFIVMEYLEGIDLAKLVRTRGPLRPDIAAEYLVQACHGLAEAHALGIVHRDVKPGNLFLSRDPAGLDVLKVLDFGISKAADAAGELTAAPERASLLLGTPQYASPEQIMSPGSVDSRADIWSLGVTAFFLVSGELPFHSDDVIVMMARVMNDDPPSLATLRPDVPRNYADIVTRCLRKKPENRFADMAELAEALAQLGPTRLDPIVEHTRLLLQRGRTRGSDRPPPRSSAASVRDPSATRQEKRPGRVIGSDAPPPPPPMSAPPPPVVDTTVAMARAPVGPPLEPSTSAGVIIQSTSASGSNPPPPSASTAPSATRAYTTLFVAMGVLSIVLIAIASVVFVRTRAQRTSAAAASTAVTSEPSPSTAAAPSQPPESTGPASPAADGQSDASTRRGRSTPRASATAHGSSVPSSLRGLPATRD
jgi:eukaryotic-like serine/threonine-protein kinase